MSIASIEVIMCLVTFELFADVINYNSESPNVESPYIHIFIQSENIN